MALGTGIKAAHFSHNLFNILNIYLFYILLTLVTNLLDEQSLTFLLIIDELSQLTVSFIKF